VNVAVKRLQLPPGARALGNAPAAASHSWGPDCSYTVGSMADGRLSPGSGAKPDKRGGLLKQEHMAVQVGTFVCAVYASLAADWCWCCWRVTAAALTAARQWAACKQKAGNNLAV
jgi:hypothetical protein